jgi:hypothetical protein
MARVILDIPEDVWARVLEAARRAGQTPEEFLTAWFVWEFSQEGIEARRRERLQQWDLSGLSDEVLLVLLQGKSGLEEVALRAWQERHGELPPERGGASPVG